MTWMKRHAAQLTLTVLATLLFALSLCYPMTEEDRVTLHDGEDVGVTLRAGDTLSVPLDAVQDVKAIGLRMKNVREAKDLTLVMSLAQDGKVLAEEEIHLAKVRARSWAAITLEKPIDIPGGYSDG